MFFFKEYFNIVFYFDSQDGSQKLEVTFIYFSFFFNIKYDGDNMIYLKDFGRFWDNIGSIFKFSLIGYLFYQRSIKVMLLVNW